MSRRWTAEEDTKLVALAPTHTLRQLSDLLGRRLSCVWDHARRIGVKPRPDLDMSRRGPEARAARDATIAAEYGKPFPDLRALCAQLGMLRSNLSRDARRLGLTNPKRLKKPVEKRYRTRQYATKVPTDPAAAHAYRSAKAKAWIADKGHPRGMAGKKHSDETLVRLSEASKAMWADPLGAHNTPEFRQRLSDRMVSRVAAGEMNRGGYSRCRGGIRDDLGLWLRSAWEANYARHLNAQVDGGVIRSWRYESKTFVFQSTKRGTRCYTPDFEVTLPDGSIEWHEVKGWMDEPSKRRLAKMAECYPDERVVLRDEEWFKANRATLKACEGYER